MATTQFIAYGLALVGFVAGLIGYFGKARGDSIIDYQAKDITALKSFNETLEKELAAVKAERDSLSQTNKTLSRMATGSPELIKLTEAVTNQTAEMRKLTKAVTGIIEGNGKR